MVSSSSSPPRSPTGHTLGSSPSIAPFDASPAGVTDVVPAMVSLLVDFDPTVTDHRTVESIVRALLGGPGGDDEAAPAKHRVPVCYDEQLGPDLRDVAERCGLSIEATIAAHTRGDYRVFMYGFAPGYAYLAGVPT